MGKIYVDAITDRIDRGWRKRVSRKAGRRALQRCKRGALAYGWRLRTTFEALLAREPRIGWLILSGASVDEIERAISQAESSRRAG
jgi:hypothetical protein